MRHKSTIPRYLQVHCGGHNDSGARQRTKHAVDNELLQAGGYVGVGERFNFQDY